LHTIRGRAAALDSPSPDGSSTVCDRVNGGVFVTGTIAWSRRRSSSAWSATASGYWPATTGPRSSRWSSPGASSS